MEQLYHETNSMLQTIHMGLAQLERASDEREAQVVSQDIYSQLHVIEGKLSEMDIRVNKEPPNRRHIVRMKVDQLRSDTQGVHNAVTAMYGRLTIKWKAANEREELLHQRFKPNETVVSFDDQELQVNDRLHSSNRHVDDLISQGMSVLGNLREQRIGLVGVKSKMLSIGSAIGLSNTTLLMIDRRVREDWLIFLIGCIVTLVFMFCFYRYWKG